MVVQKRLIILANGCSTKDSMLLIMRYIKKGFFFIFSWNSCTLDQSPLCPHPGQNPPGSTHSQ